MCYEIIDDEIVFHKFPKNTSSCESHFTHHALLSHAKVTIR